MLILQNSRCARLALAAVVAALGTLGCGGAGGPELATVGGTVTLDGKPLAEAHVVFEPPAAASADAGSPSYGDTDSSGKYTLMYTRDKAGAIIGKHTVRVTTARTVTDNEGNEVQIPEKVPAKFNSESELTKEVKAGSNTIDIGLTSD